MKKNVCICIVFTVLTSLVCYSLQAQTTPQELRKIILEKDSLFWIAYNNCDLPGMRQFFTEDVEFYHDKGGISNGLDSLMASIQKGLCGNSNYRTRREAVKGTVQVFPMGKSDIIYGAIISGEHYFYMNETGKQEYLTGHARFTQLWLLKDGSWKMSRILSYDHGPAAYINKRKEITVSAKTLSQYVGTYSGPQTSNLRIRQENGSLVMIVREEKMPLYAETKNVFFLKVRDLTFEFFKDEKNKISMLRVRENGAIAEELILAK